MNTRKNLRNKKKSKAFSSSAFLGILLIAAIPGYFIFILNRGAIEQKQLKAKSIIAEATVIDEKNYFGNSPVSQEFSYSYEFTVGGKKYVGNTRDSKYRIGDVIKIKYVPTNPSFNTKLD